MTEEQTVKILALIATAYPNFNLTDERVDLWHEFMRKFPFEKGLLHLKRHIETNSFPPTIADILKKDPSQFVDYEKLKLETANRLERMDAWENKAIPYPGLPDGERNG
jgi:hypothetical protein